MNQDQPVYWCNCCSVNQVEEQGKACDVCRLKNQFWKELQDNERWQIEVLTDYKVNFDDHIIGRRLAFTKLLFDLKEERDKLQKDLELTQRRLSDQETNLQNHRELIVSIGEERDNYRQAVIDRGQQIDQLRKALESFTCGDCDPCLGGRIYQCVLLPKSTP